MSAEVIRLDDHRPHAVAHVLCHACGTMHVSVHPVGTDPARLQCRCGAQDSEIQLDRPGRVSGLRRGPAVTAGGSGRQAKGPETFATGPFCPLAVRSFPPCCAGEDSILPGSDPRGKGGSGRSAQRAGTRSRLGTLGVVLLPLLLATTAHADPVPPRCASLDGTPGYCLDVPSLRACDAAESALPEVRLQLRAVEQRLSVAAGDAIVLSRALDAQSGVVVALREQLRAARPLLPGWAWLGLGAVLGVVGSVVLALSL